MNDVRWGIDPPDPNSLYLDGIHPRFETGDDLIASLMAPLIEQILIPEPSTALLLASGLLAVAYSRRGHPKAA